MSYEHWIKYDLATGTELARGNGPEGATALQFVPEGQAILQLPEAAMPPGLPADAEAVRLALLDALLAKRAAVISAGSPSPLGVFDSDPFSLINILGSVVGALVCDRLGIPFDVEFTMADNSPVTPNETEMMMAGLAVLVRVNAAHDRARTLRTEIEGAADLTALFMIDISTGWPPSEAEAP